MTDQRHQELPAAKRRLIIGAVLRGLVVTTALVVSYYLLPLDQPWDTGTAVRLLTGRLIFLGLTVWQVRAIAGSRYPAMRAFETLGLIVPFYLLRQEHMTMTAEPPQSLVTEAVRSLEVRWIFPGQLETAVARWFGRFPAGTDSREDTYLLDPRLPGLSVKIRGGGALEVKAYRGSPGILEGAGRARGRLESWQKWSFPSSLHRSGSGDPPGWQPVRKRRRISRFPPGSGQNAARAPGLGQQPRCEVELTEVHTRGQHWRTLGFETTGPADLLRSTLQTTAALVFAHPLPGRVEPGPAESRSYAEWLSQRPGTESDA